MILPFVIPDRGRNPGLFLALQQKRIWIPARQLFYSPLPALKFLEGRGISPCARVTLTPKPRSCGGITAAERFLLGNFLHQSAKGRIGVAADIEGDEEQRDQILGVDTVIGPIGDLRQVMFRR